VLAILVLPWALPSVVSGILWRRVFDPDNGLLNSALLKLHLIHEPHVWLAGGRWAIAFITLVHVWACCPRQPDLPRRPAEHSAGAVQRVLGRRRRGLAPVPPHHAATPAAVDGGRPDDRTLLAIAIFDEVYVLNGTALNTRSI